MEVYVLRKVTPSEKVIRVRKYNRIETLVERALAARKGNGEQKEVSHSQALSSRRTSPLFSFVGDSVFFQHSLPSYFGVFPLISKYKKI